MKISVIRPSELGADDLAAWRDMQAHDPRLRNPFLAPEFALAVGRARPAARVAVLEDGAATVGFFPFELRNRVIGVPIGLGISDCQGLVHVPGLDWDPIALLKACRLPVWEFDHLMADQKPFSPYHTRVAGSPIMDVSGGYPAFVEHHRSGSLISQANRKQRGMVRDLGAERFVWDDTADEAMAALRAWKSAQYDRTQQYDRFRTPWIVEVMAALRELGAPGCRLIVSTVYAGDQPVAAHLGLRSESVLAYWFPSYDVDLSRYSAGILLCLRMAEAGAADGIDHIDLGKSDALYKDRLATGSLPVAEGRVGRSWSVTSVRRAQTALAQSVRSGRIGTVLKTGPTGRFLKGVRSKLKTR